MNSLIKLKNTYDIGLQGQDLIQHMCVKRGYSVYEKNLRQIGLEIDLILYKYIIEKDLLIVRIIEVKTRKARFLHSFSDLESLGIDRKWIKIKRHMYIIVSKLKECLNLKSSKHIIHFDLALVAYDTEDTSKDGLCKMYKYIQDVDLLI